MARINHRFARNDNKLFARSFSFFLRKQSHDVPADGHRENAIFRMQYARFNPYVRYDLNWISNIKLNHRRSLSREYSAK